MPRGHKSTRNLLRLSTKTGDTVLYVKDSTNEPGFWGINGNQVDRLNKSAENWFLVLLEGSGEAGFLLSGEQVSRGIARNRWSLQADKAEYKIQVGQIDHASRFSSFDQLLARLIGSLSPVDEEPLSSDTDAAVEEGLDDIRRGDTMSLKEYRRGRGL